MLVFVHIPSSAHRVWIASSRIFLRIDTSGESPNCLVTDISLIRALENFMIGSLTLDLSMSWIYSECSKIYCIGFLERREEFEFSFMAPPLFW